MHEAIRLDADLVLSIGQRWITKSLVPGAKFTIREGLTLLDSASEKAEARCQIALNNGGNK